MAKRKKLGRKIKKSLKSLGSSSILKSSVTLYLVLLISIGLVLMFLAKKDYNSLMVLIATGLLTNYFTKNMTITLGVAIIVSLIVRMKISNREGFKEGAGHKKKKKMKNKKKKEGKENCFVWDPDGGENEEGEWVLPEEGERILEKSKCEPEATHCWAEEAGNCKQGFSKRIIPKEAVHLAPNFLNR